VVEVFKTSVNSKDESVHLLRQLHLHFPACKINFDLEDCDHILRIEGRDICVQTVSEILTTQNFTCEQLY
jgi:hypothetical protein